MYIYLISGLISVIDSLLRHHFRSKEIGKFAKVDTVPQALLQFGGRRQVLLQAGFHPPTRIRITELRGQADLSSETIHNSSEITHIK